MSVLIVMHDSNQLNMNMRIVKGITCENVMGINYSVRYMKKIVRMESRKT